MWADPVKVDGSTADLLNPRQSSGTTLLTNVPRRPTLSLDGHWQRIVDPYDFGYVDILGERNGRGFFRDFEPRSPSDRVEYDFDTSPRLAVPGDWNTQETELLYYEGTVWYRRYIDVGQGRPETGRRFLHFGAVNHTCRVFLDGEELCTHVGGFGPFSVEVTGRLGPGRHSLVVQVNNRRESDRIPAMRSDWWNFGGITRSVSLIHVPSTFLRHAWLTMGLDGEPVGGVTVDGDPTVSVTVELPDLGIQGTAEVGADGERRVRFPPGTGERIERWHPGRPRLHRVRWTCGDGPDGRPVDGAHRRSIDAGPVDAGPIDELEDEVGFRTVRTDGHRILINDEPVFLRGISHHEEAMSGGRRSSGPEDARAVLDVAADLGANFVRLAHYQHDEYTLVEADRRGLLAWCELPVYWGIAFADEAVLANGLAQADEMVLRDRSRASVVLWSVANETLPGDHRLRFLRTLIDRVRELDPTRLTTAAMLTLPGGRPERSGEDHSRGGDLVGPGRWDFTVTDDLAEFVDVIAVNQYLGWYYGTADDMATARFTSPTGKPIVFSELGAGAKAGRHGDEGEIWTEEFQAAVYRAQLKMIATQDQCAGLSPWVLKDFRTPLRVLPEIQDGYNRKGLVSEEGEPKLAFEVVREFYRSRSG